MAGARRSPPPDYTKDEDAENRRRPGMIALGADGASGQLMLGRRRVLKHLCRAPNVIGNPGWDFMSLVFDP